MALSVVEPSLCSRVKYLNNYWWIVRKCCTSIHCPLRKNHTDFSDPWPFTLNSSQIMTMYNVKGATCHDKLTDNYHQTLLFFFFLPESNILNFLYLQYMFRFPAHKLPFYIFQQQQAALFSKKDCIKPLSYTACPALNDIQAMLAERLWT